MKNERGVTLVALITTVIILLILSGITIYQIKFNLDKYRKEKMYSDIEAIGDKVLIYYNKYGDIPKARTIKLAGIDYWEVSLNQLEGITLNYGREFRRREPTRI